MDRTGADISSKHSSKSFDKPVKAIYKKFGPAVMIVFNIEKNHPDGRIIFCNSKRDDLYSAHSPW